MTNTITDAAEARAREALAQACENAGLRASSQSIRSGQWPAVGSHPAIRAMIAFATAEAASGAGEREKWAFTPDIREAQAIAQLSEEQELSPQAVMRQALRLYQANFLRRKAGETVTWSGDEQRARDFAGPLASLPPATDPAMGLDPVTIERCAKVADRMATSTTVPEEANNAAWNLAIAIRALAAAPTIPATGEAGQ